MNPIKPPADEKLAPSTLPVYNSKEIAEQKMRYAQRQIDAQLKVTTPQNNEPDYAAMILKATNHDNIITEAEFAKYAILFNKDFAKQLDNQDPNNYVDPKAIKELSEEYYHRFNHYKPIYITNNVGKVVNVLPPQYRKLTTLDSATIEKLMCHIRAGTMFDDNNVNSIAKIKSAEAMSCLAQKLSDATDIPELRRERKAYEGYQIDFLAYKYADQYGMDPKELKDMIIRYKNGEHVVFPWQKEAKAEEATTSANKNAPVEDPLNDLPMDIFG